MVLVGVAEEDRVQPRDAPTPERRGDDPAPDLGIAHATAIVQERMAALQSKDHRQAVPHGKQVALDRGHGRARTERTASPGSWRPPRHTRGPPARASSRLRRPWGYGPCRHHGQPQQRVEGNHPARGGTGHEPMPPGLVDTPPHDRLGELQEDVGGLDRQRTQRRPEQAEAQPGRTEQQREGRDGNQRDVQEHSHGRDQMEPQGHERQRGQPDDRRGEDALRDPRARRAAVASARPARTSARARRSAVACAAGLGRWTLPGRRGCSGPSAPARSRLAMARNESWQPTSKR